jgi:hypothetical protein
MVDRGRRGNFNSDRAEIFFRGGGPAMRCYGGALNA